MFSVENLPLPRQIQLDRWETLEPYFQRLLQQPILQLEDLKQWIADRSALEAALHEAFAWLYIEITQDSNDTVAAERFQEAIQNISPRISAMDHRLNRRLAGCPLVSSLPEEKYSSFLRKARNAIELYREESAPLQTEIKLKSKEYVRIFSQMTIAVDGCQMTLQQAGALLEEDDRGRRQQIYHKIHQRILKEAPGLDDLFDYLLERRHQMAINAGYANYRDYAFRSLGRFDYGPEDCLEFHESIRCEILPLLNDLYRHRKAKLSLDKLRPWDLNTDVYARPALRPLSNTDELLENGLRCLEAIDPRFATIIQKMQKQEHLDLASRPGKRPGGYNMQLLVTGLPFIFMNASGSMHDLRTLMHESGHAVHSYFTQELPLTSDRQFPAEVSELAAMTLELFSMEHWDLILNDPEAVRRARINQLELILKILPWIAAIDQFQHWVYTQPDHSRIEREEVWLKTLMEFSSDEVDHNGLEHYLRHLWHKQLHLFEVPFYYIEYGFAQLGAIALWRQYRQSPDETLERFVAALQLGYTKSIREIYETAGVQFNFSRAYVQEISCYIRDELNSLINQ